MNFPNPCYQCQEEPCVCQPHQRVAPQVLGYMNTLFNGLGSGAIPAMSQPFWFPNLLGPSTSHGYMRHQGNPMPAAIDRPKSNPKPKKRNMPPKKPRLNPPFPVQILIAMALKTSPNGQLTNKEIRKFINENYPDFYNHSKNLENTVRGYLNGGGKNGVPYFRISKIGKPNYYCLTRGYELIEIEPGSWDIQIKDGFEIETLRQAAGQGPTARWEADIDTDPYELDDEDPRMEVNASDPEGDTIQLQSDSDDMADDTVSHSTATTPMSQRVAAAAQLAFDTRSSSFHGSLKNFRAHMAHSGSAQVGEPGGSEFSSERPLLASMTMSTMQWRNPNVVERGSMLKRSATNDEARLAGLTKLLDRYRVEKLTDQDLIELIMKKPVSSGSAPRLSEEDMAKLVDNGTPGTQRKSLEQRMEGVRRLAQSKRRQDVAGGRSWWGGFTYEGELWGMHWNLFEMERSGNDDVIELAVQKADFYRKKGIRVILVLERSIEDKICLPDELLNCIYGLAVYPAVNFTKEVLQFKGLDSSSIVIQDETAGQATAEIFRREPKIVPMAFMGQIFTSFKQIAETFFSDGDHELAIIALRH